MGESWGQGLEMLCHWVVRRRRQVRKQMRTNFKHDSRMSSLLGCTGFRVYNNVHLRCCWSRVGELMLRVPQSARLFPQSVFGPMKRRKIYQEGLILILSCNCNFIFKSLTGRHPYLIILDTKPYLRSLIPSPQLPQELY